VYNFDSRVGSQAADQNNIKQIISREIRNGARNGEMVQSNQRLWIYLAARRRQRRVVQMSAVERAGLSTPNEGQHLEYEIEENRGKTSAVNLKVK
jgi:hypothetical protein